MLKFKPLPKRKILFATGVFVFLLLVIGFFGSRTQVTCSLGEVCNQLANAKVNFPEAPVDVTKLFKFSSSKIRFRNFNSMITVLDSAKNCAHRVLFISQVLYRQFFFIPVSSTRVYLEFCGSQGKWELLSAELDIIGL